MEISQNFVAVSEYMNFNSEKRGTLVQVPPTVKSTLQTFVHARLSKLGLANIEYLSHLSLDNIIIFQSKFLSRHALISIETSTSKKNIIKEISLIYCFRRFVE